jgi:hypothetical protein
MAVMKMVMNVVDYHYHDYELMVMMNVMMIVRMMSQYEYVLA